MIPEAVKVAYLEAEIDFLDKQASQWTFQGFMTTDVIRSILASLTKVPATEQADPKQQDHEQLTLPL